MTARALSALLGSALALAASASMRVRVAGYAAMLRGALSRASIVNVMGADLAPRWRTEQGHADRVLLGAAVASALPADVMRGALARSRTMGRCYCAGCQRIDIIDRAMARGGPDAVRGLLRDNGGRIATDADRAEAHAALERLRGETLEQTRARLGW